MRFNYVDGQTGYSGTWGAPTTMPTPEKVFGVFRNSFTKTATITAASFVVGNPAILTAASASNNGYDVVQADTAGQATNELFVGIVQAFPRTSTGGVWQPEDFGIIQVYGVCTNAVVANTTATIAANVLLTPNTGSALVTTPNLTIPTGTGTSDNGSQKTGIAGLAVLYQTLASSSAAGTTAATIWLRCM